MKNFALGFMTFGFLLACVAELPTLRVTWTRAERTITYHGKPVLAVFPTRIK